MVEQKTLEDTPKGEVILDKTANIKKKVDDYKASQRVPGLSEEVILLLAEINRPKLRVYISEKRNLEPVTHQSYENKDYHAEITIPTNSKLTPQTIADVFGQLQEAIDIQLKKDGLKPLGGRT